MFLTQRLATIAWIMDIFRHIVLSFVENRVSLTHLFLCRGWPERMMGSMTPWLEPMPLLRKALKEQKKARSQTSISSSTTICNPLYFPKNHTSSTSKITWRRKWHRWRFAGLHQRVTDCCSVCTFRIKKHLEETNPGRVADFVKAAPAAIKRIISDFDNFQVASEIWPISHF